MDRMCGKSEWPKMRRFCFTFKIQLYFQFCSILDFMRINNHSNNFFFITHTVLAFSIFLTQAVFAIPFSPSRLLYISYVFVGAYASSYPFLHLCTVFCYTVLIVVKLRFQPEKPRTASSYHPFLGFSVCVTPRVIAYSHST